MSAPSSASASASAGELGRLVEARAGLDASIVGALVLKRALERRAEACGATQTAYLDKLERANDPAEWDDLLDEIIIPESWFFRDTEPFRCLAAFARTRQAAKQRPLRILSAPCAAGEEPYSAAIALLEAGFAAEQFRIEAIDISGRVIALAREGLYRANSFRREGREMRERFFDAEKDCWRIKTPPRGCVTFAQGNLLEARALLGRDPYDAIFCRNLLIYLKRPAREKLIQTLAGLLRPGGLLFVGHAEILHGLSDAFELAPHPRAYAYRLRTGPVLKDAARSASTPTPTHPKQASHTTAMVSRGPASLLLLLLKKTVARAKPRTEAGGIVLAAQRMADEGRLDEARETLQSHVAAEGTNSGAWCLLGMVNESQGRARDAEECYQKALYLESDCYDALVHLAFLAEQRRDGAQVARLRQRAQRVLAEERA